MKTPNDFDFSTRTLEATAEQTAVAWAENNGWEVRKCQYIGRNGCPDRFFFGYGRILPVEFKRAKGKGTRAGTLSEGQVLEHKRLAAVGVEVHVFWTADSAIDFLKGYM
jgi:hypothetical protein